MNVTKDLMRLSEIKGELAQIKITAEIYQKALTHASNRATKLTKEGDKLAMRLKKELNED